MFGVVGPFHLDALNGTHAHTKKHVPVDSRQCGGAMRCIGHIISVLATSIFIIFFIIFHLSSGSTNVAAVVPHLSTQREGLAGLAGCVKRLEAAWPLCHTANKAVWGRMGGDLLSSLPSRHRKA